MRRFFLPDHALSGDRIDLTGPDARHIDTVLRLKPGQAVEFFDGRGSVYSAVLDSVAKGRVGAVITATHGEQTRGITVPLTLAQCLLKGKKMDLLVQKATELGVHAFLPLISRYCENHGDRDRQQERWQRIMLEACKQCHRATPMAILPATPLDHADFSSSPCRLAAWEGEQCAALPELDRDSGGICLLLGPEGGLHSDDLAVLRRWEFTTFSLGPLILRGETAALAATAIVRYLSGGLRPAVAPDSPSLFSAPGKSACAP